MKKVDFPILKRNQEASKSKTIENKDSQKNKDSNNIPKDNNKNENEKEEVDEIKNALFYIGQDNFGFLKEKNKEEDKDENEDIFLNYIQKMNFIQSDKFCTLSKGCLIKIGFHIRGVIFNNQNGIGFYSYEFKRIVY